jgi:hypothetical protein
MSDPTTFITNEELIRLYQTKLGEAQLNNESLRAEVERVHEDRNAKLMEMARIFNAERDQIIERCAEVCDSMRGAGSFECAAAIRAMKNDPVA